MTKHLSHGCTRRSVEAVRDVDRRTSGAVTAAAASMRLQWLLLAHAYAWVMTIAGWIDRFSERLITASMPNPANSQPRLVKVFVQLRMISVQLAGDCGELLIERAYVVRRYERFLLRCRCGLIDAASVSCMSFADIACYRLIAGSETLLDEIEDGIVSYEGRVE